MGPFSLFSGTGAGSQRDWPEVDLRSRRTEGERMGTWTRRLYQGLLGTMVAAGALGAVLHLADVVLERSYRVTLGVVDDTLLVVSEADRPEGRPVPGDRVVAVQGVAVPPGPDVLTLAGNALDSPGPVPLELTLVAGDGSGPEETEAVTLPPLRGPVGVGLAETFYSLVLVLIGVIGLLALQARDESPAVPIVVQLCVVVGLASLPFELWMAWTSVFDPLASLTWVAGMPRAAMAGVPLLMATPIVIGYLLLRLLYVFPTPDPELEAEYPLPLGMGGRALWLLVLAATLAGAWVVVASSEVEALFFELGYGMAASPWAFIPLTVSVVVVLLGVLCYPFWLMIAAGRVLRLARRRLDDVPVGSEEARQVRLALVGVRVGALLCLLALAVLLTWIIADTALANWTEEVTGSRVMDGGGMGEEPALLSFLMSAALAAPFVGVGLAIMRQGLWDVDLVAQRATLWSGLGGAFLLFWFLANEGIEALFPSGLVGAGPVLAALAVTTLRRPAARAVNRIFPGAVDFQAAMERVAHRLGEPPGGDPTAHLGEALAQELGSARAAVFVREGGSGFRAAWSWGVEGLSTELAASVAPVLGQVPDVLVRTDAGPLLASRVGGGTGYPGFVVLGPRGDGRFFTSAERREMGLVLASAASLLRAGA